MPVTAYEPPRSLSVLPPVVKNLLIMNALAFFAQLVFAMRAGAPFGTVTVTVVEQLFALWPIGAAPGVPSFAPWQLATSAFLHGSFTHLFLNMLGLWMFGMRIENVLGSRRFLTFYALCVLGASLLQLLISSWAGLTGGVSPAGLTLGASGGVLGVLAAFGLLYPDEPIYLYFFIPIPAKWLVLGLAAFDLYAGVNGSQAGVANFAHLGGMLVGAVLILTWRRRARQRLA